MPKTFGQMQDEILLQADMNNHDRPAVKIALNAALQELCSERRWSWMADKEVVLLTAGSATSPNPGASAVNGRIQRVVAPQYQNVPVPSFVRYDTEDAGHPWIRATDPAPSGFPLFYTFDAGGQIRFDAAPLVDVTYEFTLWEDAPQMAVDGADVPVPDAFLDALMWNALARVLLIHDHEANLFQIFRMHYIEAVQKLVRRDIGQTQTLRVPMPPGYGGGYDVE